MAVFNCKMCGGLLNIMVSSVATCEYCGAQQTVSSTKSEIIRNLFNRANNLRLKNEFDSAQEVYEKILNEDNTEAEAHWGIVLCKYGVEYVEDPKTKGRVPTCHRTLYNSILTDADYTAAIMNADSEQQAIYLNEATTISRLQKNILSIVEAEEPFDIFICYKESDENGKRTPDSVIANDIYYHLTHEGLKVFYAAITLEDKLGQEYEPYIFAAIQSAKVMLVIGTKPEYFNAVWVKNEWSRFLQKIKEDRRRILIPCYRDMDAYDLPNEFAHLQAQDMSKIGFINDLIRGIMKISTKEDTSSKTNGPGKPAEQIHLAFEDWLYVGEAVADKPHGYGKAMYKNGDLYEGSWGFGEFSGHGKYTWGEGESLGDRYEGEWKDGKRNGQGTYFNADGTSYTGEFKDDKLWNGCGTIVYNDGGRYEGTIQDGRCFGHGKFASHDGSFYEGEFKDGDLWNGYKTTVGKSGSGYEGTVRDGQESGHGKYTYRDGEFYEGEFKDGEFNGHGTYFNTDGTSFIGEFKDGYKWSGSGTIVFRDGARYEGAMQDGQYSGHGKYTFKNGNRYEGEWKDGKRNGQGTYFNADGTSFTGEFKDSFALNGSGTTIYKDGTRYEGNIRDGKNDGYGKCTFKNGNRYEGEWKDDKRNGQGLYIYTDGTIEKGEFVDSCFYTGTKTLPSGATEKWRKGKKSLF